MQFDDTKAGDHSRDGQTSRRRLWPIFRNGRACLGVRSEVRWVGSSYRKHPARDALQMRESVLCCLAKLFASCGPFRSGIIG
jgi:hypothetical protein